MDELLTGLVQANLAAAAAIVLVLLLRKPVRSVFGARIAYALWLLILVAAAASLAPRPANLPAPTVAPAPLVRAAEDTAAQLWMWGAQSAVPAGLDPSLLALTLWVLGLVAMLAWLGWRQAQFTRLLRHGEAGPAVIGFFRPRIVTPSDFEERFDLREQAVVLAHEKIHLARHDARTNALVAAARCVCWFNPLVHVAAHTMRIDQELACDAAVVAHHPKARAPYARALLKAQLAARPLPLGCYWPAGTEHPLTERIAMLKNANPSMLRRMCGAVVIAALSAGAGYAAWAAAPVTAPAAAAPLALIEQSIAPAPAPLALQAPPPAPTKPAKPAASKDAEPSASTLPAEICLTNSCSDSAAPAPAPAPAGRVTYVGGASLPSYTPFARYFDGNSPVRFTGKVGEVRMTDGQQAELMVQGADGKTYRVMGGDPANLPSDVRSTFEGLVGSTIDVRGYLAHDRTCDGGCLVNGREVTFGDGRPLVAR